MSLTVFGHYVSQPTRAVLWTLMMKNIPHKFVKINPVVGEAESDAFLSKFPSGLVPAMEEVDATGTFFLTEGNAILVYLAEKNNWVDLLPQDVRKRAKVHQWLHWHHENLRKCTTNIFRPQMLRVMGTQMNSEREFHDSLRVMKDNMLVMTFGGLKDNDFLAGTDCATLADIAAYCELDQLEAARLYNFSEYPAVEKWMDRMKKLPQHDDVRVSLRKLADKIISNNSK